MATHPCYLGSLTRVNCTVTMGQTLKGSNSTNNNTEQTWLTIYCRTVTVNRHIFDQFLTFHTDQSLTACSSKMRIQTFHITLKYTANIFIKPQNWVDVNSRIKKTEWKSEEETGRHLMLNIVQSVPGVKYASTHMGHAENPKKHWNLSASAITNCALMPSDADAANIPVKV